MIRRDHTIILLLVCAVIVGIMLLKRDDPPVDFPLVAASAPIIAPARSVPCTIPLPVPNPVRRA